MKGMCARKAEYAGWYFRMHVLVRLLRRRRPHAGLKAPHTSLGDVRFHANTERFQGLVPLWSHLCPLSVRLGGVCGSYSESP